MSILKDIPSTHGIVERFTRYLNGPLGRKVLDNLEEGESFIVQTSDYILRVTKLDGHAFVEELSQME